MIRKMLPKFLMLSLLATVLYSCSDNEGLVDSEQSVDSMEELILKLPNEEGATLLVPNQYIIIYNTNTTGIFSNRGSYSANKTSVKSFTENLLKEKNIQDATIIYTYSEAVAGVTLRLSENQMNALKNDDRIAIIEQDRITQFAPPCGTPNGGPCDPGGGGGGGGSSAQEIPWGITRVNGIPSYTGNGVAWILDSGIDLTHPDLNVDPTRGFNAFTSGPDGQSLNDLNGHGSHVSGTIAAKNNTIGVIGVAPGATVIPVKVLDKRGSGSYSGVIAGVDYVAANGNNGDVANMSLGGPISTALESAITSAAQAGVTFLLAAGNESQNANNVSPARLNGNNIYTISAMGQGDNWASFSNFANPPVDFCAPGVGVLSTWKNGGYNTINGTSMATPHAAGVFLLGNPSTDGSVNGDPDGNADAIIVH